jgi:hypothetical protein
MVSEHGATPYGAMVSQHGAIAYGAMVLLYYFLHYTIALHQHHITIILHYTSKITAK